MRTTAKRITFRLRESTIEGIDALVRRGVARSRNAVIEALVGGALRGIRRQEWEAKAEKTYADAFSHHAYAGEQEELLRDFSAADAESVERLDP